MSSRSKKSRKGRVFKKKLLRVCLFIAALFLMAVFFVLLMLFLYPSDKTALLISKKLTTLLERDVRVSSVSINPFGRIDIKGIEIGFTGEEKAGGGRLFTLDRVVVKFSPFSLIRHHLKINNIVIRNPELSLITTHKTIEDSTTEREVPGEESRGLSLPISIGLFSLDLTDFSFSMDVKSDSNETFVSINGLSLSISELSMPRRIQDSEMVRGSMRLFTQNSNFILKDRRSEFRTAVGLDLEAVWGENREWGVEMALGIGPESDYSAKNLYLEFKSHGIGYGETIQIDTLRIGAGDDLLVAGRGEAGRLGGEGKFNLYFDGEYVKISDLKESILPILPSAWAESVESLRYNGLIRLIKGEVKGNYKRFRFKYTCNFLKGRADIDSSGVFINDLNFTADCSGSFEDQTFKETAFYGRVRIGQIDFMVDDTTQINIQKLLLNLNSYFHDSFVPNEGSLFLKFFDMRGSDYSTRLKWSFLNSRDKSLRNLILKGSVAADSISLNILPFLPKHFGGSIDLSINLEADGLDDCGINIALSSQGIEYRLNKWEITPPIDVDSDIDFSLDSDLQRLFVKSFSLDIDDMVSCKLSGEFLSKSGKFNVGVENITINNKGLLGFIPSGIRSSIGSLDLWGEDVITLKLGGKISEGSPDIEMMGNVLLRDVGASYQNEELFMGNISGRIEISGDQDSLNGSTDVELNMVKMNRLRSNPLNKNRLMFKWAINREGRIVIEEGELSVDDLGIEAGFNICVNGSRGFADIVADLIMRIESKESRVVTDDISYTGSGLIKMKGSSSGGQICLSGNISFDSVDVVSRRGLAISDFTCRLPMNIEMNLSAPGLTSADGSKSWHLLDYESNREIYRSFYPQLGNIKIGEIEYDKYRIKNIELDLDIGNGMIQIPRFTLDLLGGNLGGAVIVRIGKDNIKDISYELSAQASRINSAVLSKFSIKDPEEAELDATMFLKGKGINFAEEVDLDGYFHITKIGSDFAEIVLRSLDPDGSDRSIGLTRKLIRMGWKPTLFSFDIHHGYVYPSLSLSQPWFSPVRIPGKLEYGRLPLEFFIKFK